MLGERESGERERERESRGMGGGGGVGTKLEPLNCNEIAPMFFILKFAGSC